MCHQVVHTCMHTYMYTYTYTQYLHLHFPPLLLNPLGHPEITDIS
jgi:hypothetical protein